MCFRKSWVRAHDAAVGLEMARASEPMAQEALGFLAAWLPLRASALARLSGASSACLRDACFAAREQLASAEGPVAGHVVVRDALRVDAARRDRPVLAVVDVARDDVA